MLSMKKRAVVTGATSFIGIALIKELLGNGYEVTAIIRPRSSRTYLIHKECSNAKSVECDIFDFAHLKDYISENKYQANYDVFYHVGWSSDFDNPRYNIKGQMRNVDYALDAMRAAKELGCSKFLGVGSQAECGLVDKPISSQTPDTPITAYAKAKCEAYRRCCVLSEELGIEFYWPRLLSAYGPYDRPGTLVMSCIDACINHKELALSGAGQIWDYVYVDDVAKALRLITEKGKPEKKYSVASGVGKPLREYIQDISDVYGYPKLMDGIGKRVYAENEVMYLVGDVSELHDDTGMTFDPEFKKHLPIPF